MKKQKFSITNRINSFKHAFNGLYIFIREEHNARIHLAAALVAITLGFVLEISNLEWLAISLAIALVYALELINTSIENLADFVSSH